MIARGSEAFAFTPRTMPCGLMRSRKIKDIVTPLWANANVKGFTYWGYIVGNTWRANTGLMTSSGTKRPALTWLMSFLSR